MDLQQRFIDLWGEQVAGGSGTAEKVYLELLRHYRQPYRYYHNLRHIHFCLTWLDRYRAYAQDPAAVELAIWFHDVCHDGVPRGHEARSARLFRKLSVGGMAADGQQRICQLILLTTHDVEPRDSDAALLVDLDLASFARSWHGFLKDSARCRAEQRHLSDAEFCRNQLTFLQGLLKAPGIFQSAPFKKNHEQSARENIHGLIDLLERRLSKSAISD